LLASLLWRALRQPGYLSAWPERFGWIARRSQAARQLLWVHAVSVGETRASESLVRAFAARWPEADLLLTHMTPTGRATGAAVFADLIDAGRLRQAWLPWDYPGASRRFLARVRPTLGVLIETEVWPNLLAAASRQSVPVALVNARLSERSLRKGLRWRALIEPALQGLDLVLAQTPSDAVRLAQLGRQAVPVIGNLKFDIEPPAAMIARGVRWRKCLLSTGARRSVIVVASTRDGEESMFLDAWRQHVGLAGDAPRPLLVIVPRHPQRFEEVAELARAQGWRTSRRSAFGEGEPDLSVAQSDVMVGDSMGEMFAWYALGDVAIIGGSFAPLGGQNLIEACAVGCPVVLGPHTFNFEQISEDAVSADAAVRAGNAAEALEQALALVENTGRRQQRSAAALAFAAQHRGATQRTVASVAPLVERSAPRLA
jgi:3-deoxy-D-manno-octulosonic-acid transferase